LAVESVAGWGQLNSTFHVWTWSWVPLALECYVLNTCLIMATANGLKAVFKREPTQEMVVRLGSIAHTISVQQIKNNDGHTNVSVLISCRISL